MDIQTSTTLLDSLYWISLVAVVFSCASGVIKAGFKGYDLFGVIIVALATALGGGSIRDVLLDREVFWIRDQMFLTVSLLSALAVFVIARRTRISEALFLIPDAAGLAAFGIAGTLVSLMVGTPWLVASFMGVMTGVMGGVLRDILCNESPVVFQSPLYATACWAGSLGFILLLYLDMAPGQAAILAGLGIFTARLMAIRFNLGLPRLQMRD